MNALIRAAADLQSVCEGQRWHFCFIGGLAVLRWGEPRETIDVELTLITGFGREREFVSVLLDAFRPRIDDAAAFAERNRVLLLRTASGVGLDIALGGLPFEELAVERSTRFIYPPDIVADLFGGGSDRTQGLRRCIPKDWVDMSRA